MPSKVEELPSPKPFLRWAGGKRRLIKNIHDSIPKSWNALENKFWEPFVGGGSVMLSLANEEFGLSGKNLAINDINSDLITTYKVIRDKPLQLINELSKMQTHVTKSDYEKMRRFEPSSDLKIAARFIYLNKTCFNGIWRVNGKGEFNVPWGKIQKPKLLDKSNILSVSRFLHGSKITNLDYKKAINKASKGDLVYFDPPYLPISPTASFSAYSVNGFNESDHFELADTVADLTHRGVYVLLSNSETPLTHKIYGKVLNLKKIEIHRTISGQTHGRSRILEVIGTNERRI